MRKYYDSHIKRVVVFHVKSFNNIQLVIAEIS